MSSLARFEPKFAFKADQQILAFGALARSGLISNTWNKLSRNASLLVALMRAAHFAQSISACGITSSVMISLL